MAKLIVIATSLSFEICTFYSLSWTNCIGSGGRREGGGGGGGGGRGGRRRRGRIMDY